MHRRSGVKMRLEHDTQVVLVAAAALVNTSLDDHEGLGDPAALLSFLDVNGPLTGIAECSEAELKAVVQLRDRLAELWSVANDSEAAEIVNELLESADALPRLVRHDDWPWHLHFARPRAALHQRLGAEFGMGFATLVRHGELDRLSHCTAPGCEALTIDLTRNRSRRYCDTGNCGNRQHVAAYRSRRRGTKQQ